MIPLMLDSSLFGNNTEKMIVKETGNQVKFLNVKQTRSEIISVDSSLRIWYKLMSYH